MSRIIHAIKGIFSIRHHYIMKLLMEDNGLLSENSNLVMIRINNPSELIDGTYSKNTQRRIIEKNGDYCDSLIFKHSIDNDYVGIISIMYKNGNELEYKIRTIDAFLYNVLVDEKYRGQHYIDGMIDLLIPYLKYKGISDLYLAVSVDNISAIKAYERIGFEIIDEKWFVRALRYNIPYYKL